YSTAMFIKATDSFDRFPTFTSYALFLHIVSGVLAILYGRFHVPSHDLLHDLEDLMMQACIMPQLQESELEVVIDPNLPFSPQESN
ncbi:hypothetical protein ACJX0J_040266, partial [Zea mays]